MTTFSRLIALGAALFMTTTALAAETKGKVLVIVSAANAIPLREGGAHKTGVFLGELTEPADAMLDAGYELVFASPGGIVPTIDEDSKRGQYWRFSKKRLTHAKAVLAKLTALGLQNPQKLEDLASNVDVNLVGFIAVFTPGGHGPLVDLYYKNMFESGELNEDMGKVLEYFHRTGKPTGLICHAPATLAAAPKVDGKWIYEGYKVTAISRLLEFMNEDVPLMRVIDGHVGEYPDEILRRAGAHYVYNPIPMIPNVVEDRELMTGQDPFSAALMGKRFVEKLDAYARKTTKLK